jgi:hypothetical protein
MATEEEQRYDVKRSQDDRITLEDLEITHLSRFLLQALLPVPGSAGQNCCSNSQCSNNDNLAASAPSGQGA